MARRKFQPAAPGDSRIQPEAATARSSIRIGKRRAAYAGRVPDRVGDRADGAGDADLADALDAERVDVGIVLVDQQRLERRARRH